MHRQNKYELLNKDRAVLTFSVDNSTGSIDNVVWIDQTISPIGFKDLGSFLAARKAPSNRAHIRRVLEACGAADLVGYLDVVHALSINDTFWVRRRGERVCWAEANLYHNELNEALARIAFEGGLVGQPIDLSSPSPEPSLGGSFAKCVIRNDGRLYILKAPAAADSPSPYLPAAPSWHPWSEVMASQVACALGVKHVEYSLVNRTSKHEGRAVTASLCPLFTSESVGFATAHAWLDRNIGQYNHLIDSYRSIGCEKAFREMVVLDALTLNTDRHMSNHGILFDTDTLEPIGMAPVFDNNLAFCPSYRNDNFVPMMEYSRRNLRPAIGDDFLLVAHAAADKELLEKVSELRHFEFNAALLRGMPKERIDTLSAIVREQAAGIVDSSSGGFNLVNERDLEYSWTLEGWPDEKSSEEPDIEL